VGNAAEDVEVGSFYSLDNPDLQNSLCNFWKSAEGLTTTNDDVTWAASQVERTNRCINIANRARSIIRG
jgi:hypothetical protein